MSSTTDKPNHGASDSEIPPGDSSFQPPSTLRSLKSTCTNAFRRLAEQCKKPEANLDNIVAPEILPVLETDREDLADKIDSEITLIESYITSLSSSLTKANNARIRITETAKHPQLAPALVQGISEYLSSYPFDVWVTDAEVRLAELRSLHQLYGSSLVQLRPLDSSIGIQPSRPSRSDSRNHTTTASVLPKAAEIPTSRSPAYDSRSDPGTFKHAHSWHNVINPSIRIESITSQMVLGFQKMESAIVSSLEKGFSALHLSMQNQIIPPMASPPNLAQHQTAFSAPSAQQTRNVLSFPLPQGHYGSEFSAHYPAAPPHNIYHAMPNIDPSYSVLPPPPPRNFPSAFTQDLSTRSPRDNTVQSPDTIPTILPGSKDQNPFAQYNRSRLPEIKLTTFDGDPKEWRNFKSTFEVVVHQRDISNIEKMLHLRQVLQGEALEAISMFENDAYVKAWNQINDIYGHKPHITDRLVRELESVPRASSSPQAQKQCLNVIRGLISMLPDCDSSTNPVLHSLVFHKFSPALQEKVVEKKTADKTSHSWSLTKLFEIITEEITLLERKQELLGSSFVTSSVNSIQSAPSHNFTTQNNHRSPSPRPLPCTFCESPNHRAKDCARTPSIQARRDFIERNNLCYNCRSPNHISKDCSHPPCRTCERFHDVSICPKYHSWNRDQYKTRTPSRTRFSNNSQSRHYRTPSRSNDPDYRTNSPKPNRYHRTPSSSRQRSGSQHSSISRHPSQERGRTRQRNPFPKGRSDSKTKEQ